MDPTGDSFTQGASGARRAPKRQRRRSECSSPRDTLGSAPQQHAAGAPQERRTSLLPGVRTRSSAAIEQQHQQEQQQQQQPTMRNRRRAARRPRQMQQLQHTQELQSPQLSPEGSNGSPKPTVEPTDIVTGDRVGNEGTKLHAATVPREGGTSARGPLRQRPRRGGARASHGCDGALNDSEGSSGALRPTSGRPPLRGSGRDSSAPCLTGVAPLSNYECPWALKEDRADQLLLLLSRTRSNVLEALLDVPALEHLTMDPLSGPCASGTFGCFQPSEEPLACVRHPRGDFSSLRVFSGAACLSQHYVATLSQEAAGLHTLLQSPAAARRHFLFFCCFLIRCAVTVRVRNGLQPPTIGPAGLPSTEDFLVRCVMAWKTYTLSLLLLKCLYARGSEALSQQQPALLGAHEHPQRRSGVPPKDAVLAAEAAGIQGAAARDAAAHTAASLLCQAASLDEAAVIIFGRFVSQPLSPKQGAAGDNILTVRGHEHLCTSPGRPVVSHLRRTL